MTAARTVDFLNSIGIVTKFDQGNESVVKAPIALTYIGARNIRDGGRNIPALLSVHQASKVKVCLLRAIDIPTTISRLEQVAAAGALMAAEGPNEPNNFPVTYGGQTSNYSTTFGPVANFQRDMYAAVRGDPKLSGIPVFHSSEAGGSEPDNVGLQFLTIPGWAKSLMPVGTKYADFANVHNYLIGGGMTQPIDNNAWDAASPDIVKHFDGIYPEYGITWHKRFTGYTTAQLQTLPRVTTETGWFTEGKNAITEVEQAKLFLNLFCAQFKRGFRYTFIYELHDTIGSWGIFHNDYTPKIAATYLHNFTTILADNKAGSLWPPLAYSIQSKPPTVHDLLLQKSNGEFNLIVWNERVGGASDNVTVEFSSPVPFAFQYDPTVSITPEKFSDISSLPLTLSDHPVIIGVPPSAPPSLDS